MRLALGTVQFGLDYGVSNQNGRPTQAEVERILTLAHDAGIATIDTALGYGDSHKVLAKHQNLHRHFNIVSKLPPLTESQFEENDAERYQQFIDRCFSELKAPALQAILFHQASDLFKSGVEPIMQRLVQMKESKLIDKVGISVYSGCEIEPILRHGHINLVQIPFNVFDTYFKQCNALQNFQNNNIEIHARSAFLQGLLLMPIDKLASYFSPWKPYIKQFHDTAKHLNASLLSLCLAYVLKEQEIAKVIIGVNSYAELSEILEAYERIDTINLSELPDLSINDSRLTNPALWKL
ncbi:aldo/keto reductase [Pseudoalteromonas sp. T1lg65]|uniref:aldo/keto reductase n=1 Tax=Pseudoalteromonas sp. T1lg65 TaxID=2077101 RepID=UPI003F7A5301